MRILLLTALILFSRCAFSQTDPKPRFGTVSLDELSRGVYSVDSTAEAIVLFEKGQTNFYYKEAGDIFLYYDTEVHVRKKILRSSGSGEGIFVLPYYLGPGADEQVIELKGFTYNIENGQVKKEAVDSKSIFTEKVQSDYYQKKVTFPNVKEGSIVEYRYLKRTPLNLIHKPATWYFQSDIPKLWSELVVTIPSHFYYQMVSGGYLPMDISEQKRVNTVMGHPALDTDGVEYRLVMKNIPAFRNEPFITTPKDYVAKVDFELSRVSFPNQMVNSFSTTWSDIDRTLLEAENWGSRLKRTGFLKEVAEPFMKIADQAERLNKAHAYMVSLFKWNGEAGLWVFDELKKVYDNKTGSASEINMVMIGLLRELGFNAHPVVLSTRNHGKINTFFPLIDRLNYTMGMVELNGEKILIDITDPLLKVGSIPKSCHNYLARVIKPAGGDNIEIQVKEKHKEMYSFDISYDEKEGKLKGKCANLGSGYYARDLRSAHGESGEEKLKQELAGKYKSLNLKEVSLENFKDLNQNTSISFEFEADEEGLESDVLYIEPMYFGKIEKNIFTKSEREFPVDFGHLTEQSAMGTFEIPEGFEVEELPKNLAVALPDGGGKFTFICTENNGKIQLVSRLIINKPIFVADEYVHLKEFYSRIVQKHNEQIILKKKK